jgi:hypothetical protein
MRYVIGIAGLKRSGKDTFARVLREVAVERGFAFVTVAFADPLRQAAAAAYGVDVYAFTDDARKDEVCPAWGITHRQMLINLGEAMRGIDQDHWVKAWRRVLNGKERLLVDHAKFKQAWARLNLEYTHEGKPLGIVVAVPDVRRLNEAAAVHDAGGVNVLVQRPGVEWNGHVTELLAEVSREHGQRSYEELSLFSDLKQGTWHPADPQRSVFDAGIYNDGDVAALRPRAERVLDMVLKGAK